MTSRAGSGRIGAIPRDDVAETDETRSVKNDRTGENSHSSNRNHKIHHNTETVGFHTESGELISPIRPARLSLALNEPNEEMAPIPMDRKVEQAARATPVKSPTVSVQSLQPHTGTAELQKQRREIQQQQIPKQRQEKEKEHEVFTGQPPGWNSPMAEKPWDEQEGDLSAIVHEESLGSTTRQVSAPVGFSSELVLLYRGLFFLACLCCRKDT